MGADSINALDMIMQRGVRFRLPAPRYLKLLKRDTVTIKPPTVGTALALLREAVAYDLAEEEMSTLYANAITPRQLIGVKRVVAIAILGSDRYSERQLDKLVAKLDEVLLQDLLHLYNITMTMCRGENFRKATLSVWALMRMLRVRPKSKMSQESEGSIASSVSLVSGKEIED
ncbi:MAG: hypothetical protein PUK66_07100 [Bacteroidales bacterium]|uniref:hypothetical protein n=1 Tax=Porphyromonas sp. TaxID=1924944 RepID=UPI00297218F5|nr:hypothetical protein [Porphyromonas sp.]MDD7438578.1 hypothetical protein [Bacteroidales bacterium]MDY3067834.1 hypothetical protein [Porphyromonas sp.]